MGNDSVSSPSLLLLGHLECLGLYTQGWQLGNIQQCAWPLALFAVTMATSCRWLDELPDLDFLVAWWERMERSNCVATLPKCALTIHALHQLLGWKDLEQSIFFKCQVSGWETVQELGSEVWTHLGPVLGLDCLICSRNRDTVERGSNSPATGSGEDLQGFLPPASFHHHIQLPIKHSG